MLRTLRKKLTLSPPKSSFSRSLLFKRFHKIILCSTKSLDLSIIFHNFRNGKNTEIVKIGCFQSTYASFEVQKRSVLHSGTDLSKVFGYWEKKYVISLAFSCERFLWLQQDKYWCLSLAFCFNQVDKPFSMLLKIQ